jgi:hypothetical protein
MRRLALALMLLCASLAIAQTTVTDTITRPDGSPAVGTAKISWPSFTTTGAVPVAAGSMTITLGAGGAFSASLQPTVGATPAGTLYTVVFTLNDASTVTEYWNVPGSGPTTVAAVRSTAPPYSLLAGTSSGPVEFTDWDQTQCSDGAIPKKISGVWSCGTDNSGAGGTVPDPGANGFIVRTGSGLATARIFTAGSSKISLTNPDGVSGNPIIDIVDGNLTPSWANITGKPSFATVATSGSYTDLINKPTIPAAQVNSDWTAGSGVAQILNKPATFPPSAHTHVVANITDFPLTWDWSKLTNIPSVFPPATHSHLIADISDLAKAGANGVASLDANLKVVQNPASASTTPIPNGIPIADNANVLDVGWLPIPNRVGRGTVFISAPCVSGKHVSDIDQVTGELICSDDSAGSAGYNRVQDEGVDLTQRSRVNFKGVGVTAVDNAGTTTTDVTVDLTAGGSTTGASGKYPLGLVGNRLDPSWIPLPGLATLGGFQTKDCTGIGHIKSANSDGTYTCSADAAGNGGDNITVNGVAASDANLNDADPAAPSGQLPVKWQLNAATTPDNISAYVAPPGSDQQILFNDGGLWGTWPGFTFNKATLHTHVPGPLDMPGGLLWSGSGTSTTPTASTGKFYIDLSNKPSGCTDVSCGNLAFTSQLAQTLTAVSHQFVTSYSAATGLFTLAALVAGDIPDLSATYTLKSREGAANGVAPLDSGGLVPASKLGTGGCQPIACTRIRHTASAAAAADQDRRTSHPASPARHRSRCSARRMDSERRTWYSPAMTTLRQRKRFSRRTGRSTPRRSTWL